MILKYSICILLTIFLCQHIQAQQGQGIQWLSFEQLEDSLAIKPKKVFINFYADWCVYCKKMDKVVFKDSAVISALNKSYYVVKMNAESTDTIVFDGQIFINKQVGKKRNPTHQIPLLLASRKGYPFTLPALVFLNKKFEVTERYFEYIDKKRLLNTIYR